MTVVLAGAHRFEGGDGVVYPAGTVAEVAAPEDVERETARLRAAFIDPDGLTLVWLGGRLRWVEAG